MARPESNTVNYFPHLIGMGKKMFFIEHKYKNDGYATWFKILEKLAETDYHYLNLNNEEEVMYLAAKCNIDEDRLLLIINDLARIGSFDKELWDKRLIWCQTFIDSIQDAYLKRKNECPTKEHVLSIYSGINKVNSNNNLVNSVIKPQSKVNESKVNESKELGENNLTDVYFKDFENSTDLEILCSRTGKPKDYYISLIPRFKMIAESKYINFNAFVKHFKNWAVKQKSTNTGVKVTVAPASFKPFKKP